MNKLIAAYLESLQRELSTGRAAEQSYRHAFKALIEASGENINAVNDGRRVECGAPDFIVSKGDIIVGYVETKDIGKDLGEIEGGEQMGRYLEALDNLILTDYLEFHFYKAGEKVETVRIGEIKGSKIVALAGGERLMNLLADFVAWRGRTVGSASGLAKLMAAKARLMRDVLLRTLEDKSDEGGELREQFKAFRHVLIRDMKEEEFADMYAQTIAYGLFAARLNDTTPESFTRQEARDLVPKTNPFLLSLFNYVAGPQLDTRVSWVVDSLAEIFQATDMEKVMKSFGQGMAERDPVIHFYETFLGAYDPKLRQARGVWYTPEPVVKFIVRAADDALKSEFGLVNGLADNSMISIKSRAGREDKRFKDKEARFEKAVHRVRLLDPATGTGTFLAEAVRRIYTNFKGQEGVWKQYVNEHLMPRLFGFELLMAPYTMAHLKLDWLLRETGYRHDDVQHPKRLGIYLTNSLEPAYDRPGTIFENFLSNEGKFADVVKNETSVMVVFGNPPYSGLSANMGEWATKLIEPYKKEPGGKDPLDELKHWLNDDYVKFIRLAEDFIERNGEGVLAYITNHGYLDNPTFRGMRWHLLNTFDKLYVLDLHGNTKKREKSPDGSKDENVFDIQQGVSIIIAVCTKNKKGLGKVYHADLWGGREAKYAFLEKETLKSIEWKSLPNEEPYYFFVPKDFSGGGEYGKGFSVTELFPVNVTGIVTARDGFVIDSDKNRLAKRIEAFCDLSKSDESVRQEFFGHKKSGKYPPGDSRGWKLPEARKVICELVHEDHIKPILYRPFDVRWIYYHPKMVDWGREKMMPNFLRGENIGLATTKLNRQLSLGYTFITKWLQDFHILDTAGDSTSIFPLYLINEAGRRTPNLSLEVVGEIEKVIKRRPKSEEVFDYVYATLHALSYREKYAEFLKIDFPRIPYPKDAKTFGALAKKGAELRELHLMESPTLAKPITTFPKEGSNVVEKAKFEKGKVFINDEQYFEGVPKIAWEFFIGGYQPAQKWLKDRKGEALSYDYIVHWQKIIVALVETDRIMKEIDDIL